MTGQVHFTGPLEDVRAFVAALDVGFVLSWRETISFACREMMAMGVPVIVSNHGGLPENIDDSRNGWIVDCHDIDAIARLVQYLATHSDEVARMGIAAKLRAQSAFGLSAYVAATENVYHQVLAV
jgi:glycosyltransferase involved in cell wall biosynthesis